MSVLMTGLKRAACKNCSNSAMVVDEETQCGRSHVVAVGVARRFVMVVLVVVSACDGGSAGDGGGRGDGGGGGEVKGGGVGTGGGVGGGGSGSWAFHRPGGCRVPSRTVLLSFVM